MEGLALDDAELDAERDNNSLTPKPRPKRSLRRLPSFPTILNPKVLVDHFKKARVESPNPENRAILPPFQVSRPRRRLSAMSAIPLMNRMADDNRPPPARPRKMQFIEISDDSNDDFSSTEDFLSTEDSPVDFDENTDVGSRQRSGNIQGNMNDLSQQPNNMAARQPGMNSVVGQPQTFVPGSKQNWHGDYILDEAWDDPDLAMAMIQEITRQQPQMQFNSQPRARQPEPLNLPPLNRTANLPINDPVSIDADAPPHVESRTDVVVVVMAVFPDICQDHVSELYSTVSQTSMTLVAHILDQSEKGETYPKSKDKEKTLKRKREVDENATAAAKYGAVDRAPLSATSSARQETKKIISAEFGYTAMNFIEAVLKDSGQHLFNSYRVLEEAERTYNLQNPPYAKLKYRRAKPLAYEPHNIQRAIDKASTAPEIKEVYLELQAARKARADADALRAARHQEQLDEEENERKAQAEGTMSECGCCFCDYPMNRMVHCNADTLHWFCKGCTRQNAETIIGNSKYELHCMSMDGCEGGFSNDQRAEFLDPKTTVALERNEQEAMLRMAGIENLASCPFCPYAAEYPPVEVDKEFRCQAPDCEKTSCRLCKLESHIPKSCDEFAKENGLSIRRQIEEAMSAALIRNCNKCGTPFVKEEGCNKMTCTRNGCMNVQCYICSKSCSYDHFNDSSRGGKAGNCPLFENVEERHNNEIANAEKAALAKVRAEHPEYTDEDLKIKVSEAVLKDDEARKARDPTTAARHVQARAMGRHRFRDLLRARAQRAIPAIPAVPFNPADPLFHLHQARAVRGGLVEPLKQDFDDFLAFGNDILEDLALDEHGFPDAWNEQKEARPPNLPPPPPPLHDYQGLYPRNVALAQGLGEHIAPPDPNILAPPGRPHPVSPPLERARLRARNLTEAQARRQAQMLEHQRRAQEPRERLDMRMAERRQAEQGAQARKTGEALAAKVKEILNPPNQPFGAAGRHPGREAQGLPERLNGLADRHRPAVEPVVQPHVRHDDYMFQINQLDDAMRRVAKERAELDAILDAEAIMFGPLFPRPPAPKLPAPINNAEANAGAVASHVEDHKAALVDTGSGPVAVHNRLSGAVALKSILAVERMNEDVRHKAAAQRLLTRIGADFDVGNDGELHRGGRAADLLGHAPDLVANVGGGHNAGGPNAGGDLDWRAGFLDRASRRTRADAVNRGRQRGGEMKHASDEDEDEDDA